MVWSAHQYQIPMHRVPEQHDPPRVVAAGADHAQAGGTGCLRSGVPLQGALVVLPGAGRGSQPLDVAREVRGGGLERPGVATAESRGQGLGGRRVALPRGKGPEDRGRRACPLEVGGQRVQPAVRFHPLAGSRHRIQGGEDLRGPGQALAQVPGVLRLLLEGHSMNVAQRGRSPVGQRKQAEDRDRGCPQQQQHRLDGLGDHHRLQAPQCGVDDREQGNDADGDRDVEVEVRGQRAPPAGGVDFDEGLHDLGARVQRDADVNEQRSDHGHERQDRARGRAVAALEILREGGDAGPEVERGEDQAEDDQEKRGQPLEVAEHHPLAEAGAGEAGEVDGGDVGGEQGQPDGEPAEGSTRQEVPGARRALVTGEPEADPGDAREVGDDDRHVDPVNGHGPGLSSSSVWGGGVRRHSRRSLRVSNSAATFCGGTSGRML